jgi:outer membrane protein assembly factor BamB
MVLVPKSRPRRHKRDHFQRRENRAPKACACGLGRRVRSNTWSNTSAQRVLSLQARGDTWRYVAKRCELRHSSHVFLLFRAMSLAVSIASTCLRARVVLLFACVLIRCHANAETPVLTNAWSFVLGYPSDSSPAIGDDGTIYLGVWNGDFRAFSPDGSPKWVFHAGREIKSSPAIGADGTLYFGSRDRKLYAVGAEGKKKWEFKTGAWVDSSPAVASDGTIYFGSWDRSFYALREDGSERWSFRTGGEIVSSPAVSGEGTIYFGSHDGMLYALNPLGSRAWQYRTGGPIISSPAIDKDGSIYFTSIDGFFYSLSAQGALNWRLKTGGITESSPVIGRDGTIYVGVNTTLWAISLDGKKKWEQLYGDLIDAAPLALADNTVCCVSRMGGLFNQGAPNEFHWVYNQNWCGTVSPAIGPDGRIYTMRMGISFFLCALENQVKLAQSPWPKFRADEHNTGRQNKYTR